MKIIKKTAAVMTAAIILAAQAAYAYEIDVQIDSFTVTASLQSDIGTERPTIQMLDSTKSTVLYMGEGTSVQNDDDTYTFSFEPFNVPDTLATGQYIIRIGGEGTETEEATVSFVNVKDKGDALNAVNSSANKTASIIENKDKLGLDTSALEVLSDGWKSTVDIAVAAVDLSNDGSEGQVEEKTEVFLAAYMPALEKAVIAGSDDAGSVNTMIEESEYLGLDKDGWYSKLSNKSSVAAIIVGRDLSTDITAAELKNEFDGAVLVSVIDQLDHGSAREAFEQYEGAGLIDVNMSDFEDLSETNKANVFKDLKKRGITNYEELPDEFKDIVGSYKSSGNGGGGNGNVGGGGSPSGGGGTSTVLPGNIPDSAMPTPRPTVAPTTQGFTDMNGFEWAEEAVEELSERGVVNGDGSGHFKPQDYITREEFAKIAVTAFGLYDDGANAEFTDVPQEAWFYRYVASAKNNGIVTGISDSEFGAGMNITRQDMAVMLKRIFDMAQYNGITPNTNFSDYFEIADYAKDAVSVLSGAGILNGMDDGRFEPAGKVTRAQSAKAVYELLKLIEQ